MKAAVCGSPIQHSLSPALHRAAYAALGLDGWSYDLLEVDEERLPSVVGALDATWAGLSLTMPLKQAVVPLVDEVSDFARAVGSVNTVVVTPRLDRRNTPGRRGVRLRAENTDVIGLVTALAEAGADRVRRGVVLGGGATARSAVVALLQAGCPRPVVVVRSPDRAVELKGVAARLGGEVEVRDWSELPVALSADVVVSTVPIGGSDAMADAVLGAFRPVWWPLLLDVVYAPWPTPLAQRWGGTVVGGFEMLLHQAVAQVELMTGRAGPVEAMRAAGLAALRKRARA
ncbi:shikimate dehydrogenase [Kineococcus radiotolerans]|uniref:Shikimate dehydrogenase substrate binding domain protein n=1 Tax=Kineococcus radiotolerans (strain ATCC BAA-149 / DSM 14245 / SRS30216) TaxID=266940 RepID=A6WCF4_KINRD|nr:shikimate dehydrogenase [Kineococcus radiotolerans]ABS04493.1 Shikimate dehydrogenase substrate binding domain protein [Kineococcus radiotolerans SRS30216 = ATCC BAA-149]